MEWEVAEETGEQKNDMGQDRLTTKRKEIKGGE